MRRPHFIKPNKNSEQPSRAMFLSIDMEERSPRVGEYSYHFYAATAVCAIKIPRTGEWKHKTYPMQRLSQIWTLLEDLTKNRTKTYLICNNSNYTLQIMNVFTTAPQNGWKIGLIVVNCPPCIVKMRKGSKSVTIIDVQNIWPTLFIDTSVGANGEPTKKIEKKLTPTSSALPSEAAAQMMFQTMTDWWTFLKTNDLGGFSPTIGAQAVRTWRHRFMTEPVFIDTHADALQLARDSLCGGRNECFRVGSFHGDFWMLDTNACYASCLGSMRVPKKLLGFTTNATCADLTEWTQTSVVIADVTISTDENAYPYRRGPSVSFPTGTFRCVLAGAELVSALVSGRIVGVHRAACYESGAPFQSYVQQLWNYRIEARSALLPATEAKWKVLTASFFGKWAQKGGFWENEEQTHDLSIRHWLEYDMDTEEANEYRQVGGNIQRRSHETESGESHPAIASCCTAEARTRLNALIKQAGRDDTYYVDTDSILVGPMGFGRLHDHIAPNQLGRLKILWHAKSVQIFTNKNYRRDGIWTRAGIRSDAHETDAGYLVQVERVGYEESVFSEYATGARARTVAKRKAYKNYSRFKRTNGVRDINT